MAQYPKKRLQKGLRSGENTEMMQEWEKNWVSGTMVVRTFFIKLMFASHESIILISAHNHLSFTFLPERVFI